MCAIARVRIPHTFWPARFTDWEDSSCDHRPPRPSHDPLSLSTSSLSLLATQASVHPLDDGDRHVQHPDGVRRLQGHLALRGPRHLQLLSAVVVVIFVVFVFVVGRLCYDLLLLPSAHEQQQSTINDNEDEDKAGQTTLTCVPYHPPTHLPLLLLRSVPYQELPTHFCLFTFIIIPSCKCKVQPRHLCPFFTSSFFFILSHIPGKPGTDWYYPVTTNPKPVTFLDLFSCHTCSGPSIVGLIPHRVRR